MACSRQVSSSSHPGDDTARSPIRTPDSGAVSPFAVTPCCKELWLPDDAASACAACKQRFTIMKRRHHCRMCGNLFHAMPCCNRLGTEESGDDASSKAQGVWICQMCEDFYSKHYEDLCSGCLFMMLGPDGDWRGVRVWLSSEGLSMQLNWETTRSKASGKHLVLQQSLMMFKISAVEQLAVKSVMDKPVPHLRIVSEEESLTLEAFSLPDHKRWLRGLKSARYVCQQEQMLTDRRMGLENSSGRS